MCTKGVKSFPTQGRPPPGNLGSKEKGKMLKTIRVLSTAGLLFCNLLILSPTSNAQEPAPQVEVTPPTHHHVPPPLHEIHHLTAKRAFPTTPFGPMPHSHNVP